MWVLEPASDPLCDASSPHYKKPFRSSLMLGDSGHLSDRMNTTPGNQPLRLLKGSNSEVSEVADADLLQAVRAGDAQAAARFHDRVVPVVTRTVSRLLGSRDPDFDDAIQQSLIELVVTVDRFLGDCPLDAWTSIISARVVYRQLRRRKLERRLFVMQGPETVDSMSRSVSNPAMLRMAIRRVETHLHAIDSKKAWTFILHDVHGYSLAEISEITGGTVAAVQTRLVRARKELHGRIAESGDLPLQLIDLVSQMGAV